MFNIHSGNFLTSFSALYCNAWYYGFDFQCTSASYGRKPCKLFASYHFFQKLKLSCWRFYQFFIKTQSSGIAVISVFETHFLVNRVTKLVSFKQYSLWPGWTHCCKQLLGRGYLQWWVHHLLSSYQCWQLSMTTLIRTSQPSMMYVKYKLHLTRKKKG